MSWRMGEEIFLRGPGGQVLDGVYTFAGIPLEDGKASKSAVRVNTPDGVTIRVHKSRVVKERRVEMSGPEKEKEAKEAKVAKPNVKKEKKVKEVVHFDLDKFIQENGKVALKKRCDFDHKKYTLDSYLVVDEARKKYHFLNVYTHPDGSTSLGKNNTISTYPLKGNNITRKILDKKTGTEPSKTIIGSKSAMEVVDGAKKKGYHEV